MKSWLLLFLWVAFPDGSTLVFGQNSGAPKKTRVAGPQRPATNLVQAAVDSYVREDYAEALIQWRRLADQGNAFAQDWVAGMLSGQLGTANSSEESDHYARMAAEQGYTHKKGLGNGNLALQTWRDSGFGDAAGKWDFQASTTSDPRKVQQDCAEVVACVRRAAELAKPIAEMMLANLYLSGLGVSKDEREFARWIQRAAADGNARSMRNVGFYYEGGWYTFPKDLSEAVVWWRRAATAGDSDSQLILARRYQVGDEVPKDYAAAESWYLKAATDPRNAERARFEVSELYQQVAFQYRIGSGLEKDLAAAAKWYQKALEFGSSHAALSLAQMYETGAGVLKDYSEAERLYRKYAEMLRVECELDAAALRRTRGSFSSIDTPGGYASALAELLTEGARGVPKDHNQAAKLYILWAERGYPPAWPNAGRVFEKGDGVPMDLVKAYFWYNVSAARISNYGRDRDRVERLLSSDQIAEGQELSRRWREQNQTSASSVTMPAPVSVNASVDPSPSGIRSEIDRITREGGYAPLPVSAQCESHSGAGAVRTVENATGYQLRLVFSGPVDREATIAPGQKQAINLPAGFYKVAGRVASAGVLPFYGQETFKAGEECAVQFYVK